MFVRADVRLTPGQFSGGANIAGPLLGWRKARSPNPTISPHSRMSFNAWFGYRRNSTTKLKSPFQMWLGLFYFHRAVL